MPDDVTGDLVETNALKGVLDRVPANLPAVSWAAPEEIRRWGRSRQRRHLATTSVAGVAAVALGLSVAVQANWPGRPADGSIVAGAALTEAPPASPGTPARTAGASAPTAPPTVRPSATVLTSVSAGAAGPVPAEAMLAATDLPGRYALVDSGGGLVSPDRPTAWPDQQVWLFSDLTCAGAGPAPTTHYLRREAVRTHVFEDAKARQVDQTVERYPDVDSAALVMSDISGITRSGCVGTKPIPVNVERGFAGDDSVRFLATVKGGSDGTYWTVVRTGRVLATLRTPETLTGTNSRLLNPVAVRMVERLCAVASHC